MLRHKCPTMVVCEKRRVSRGYTCDKKVPKINRVSEVVTLSAKVQHVFTILTHGLVMLRSVSSFFETRMTQTDFVPNTLFHLGRKIGLLCLISQLAIVINWYVLFITSQNVVQN
jgi:hypothetical protein